MWSCDFFEKILRRHGYRIIAGVDEVGRGALAGPVVAAAVVLDGEGDYSEIRDSKVLSPRQRAHLAVRIRGESLAMGIGSVTESEIDRINILQATHIAMRLAIDSLPVRPDAVLVDGFWLPGVEPHCIGIIHGDARSYSIAAASIVAKVHRDTDMISLATRYPHYGFDRHKGYGTREHLEAIAKHGPCPCHRRTFAGVGTPDTPRESYAR
jgi:ribonuclease HII